MRTPRRFILLLVLASIVGQAEGRPGPKPPRHEFSFVVLGDSQFHYPGEFNQLFDEVAVINPSFVLQIGDMIRGYVETDDEFRAQWKRFKDQISGLGSIPFYPVPGNHDVYSKDRTAGGAKVYQEEWGDLYYSFDYRNAHFTVLDTDQAGEFQSMTGQQLKWLEADLHKARRKDHRFIFFHRPTHLLENGDELHHLFIEHKVTAVFGGHQHHYHEVIRDEPPYIMTMAAASLVTDTEKSGSFHHFLHVTVRDDDFTYAVVQKGGAGKPGFVVFQDNKGLYRIRGRLFRPRSVVFESLEIVEGRSIVPLELTNPTDQELHVYLEWKLPTRWAVSPARGTLETLPPVTERQKVSFELDHVSQGKLEAYPTFKIQTLYLTHDDDWITTERTFEVLAKPKDGR
ncbi:MAG: hypothetical protein CME19_08975 [Gemmatimonadetes bacterium]|nr:hypothetical protein [Gemmatimonadota bacterium]